jgi:hypothetical protein
MTHHVRVIRSVLVATILASLAFVPTPAHAQLSQLRTVQHRSCASMDSLLGPFGRVEKHAVVMAWYDKNRDATTMDAGPRVSGRKYMLALTFSGHDAPLSPTPLFGVFFPAKAVLDTSEERGAHLMLVLTDTLPTDTLRLDLGPFKAPTVTGRTPVRLPAAVRLSSASFMALARARSATVSLDTLRVALGDAEMAEINVMYRVSRCGVR